MVRSRDSVTLLCVLCGSFAAPAQVSADLGTATDRLVNHAPWDCGAPYTGLQGREHASGTRLTCDLLDGSEEIGGVEGLTGGREGAETSPFAGAPSAIHLKNGVDSAAPIGYTQNVFNNPKTREGTMLWIALLGFDALAYPPPR